jgi:hypothetical protein
MDRQSDKKRRKKMTNSTSTQMNTNKKTTEMRDTKILLALLWIFFSFNFVFLDQRTFMEPGVLEETMTGYVAGGTVQITQGFLLGTAIIWEIAFLMIVLSWVLKYRANRWANIIAGTIMAVLQIGSLFLGTPSLQYIFYSIMEIACLLLIVWNAWKWPKQEA